MPVTWTSGSTLCLFINRLLFSFKPATVKIQQKLVFKRLEIKGGGIDSIQ
jgi:hypothetical protein